MLTDYYWWVRKLKNAICSVIRCPKFQPKSQIFGQAVSALPRILQLHPCTLSQGYIGRRILAFWPAGWNWFGGCLAEGWDWVFVPSSAVFSFFFLFFPSNSFFVFPILNSNIFSILSLPPIFSSHLSDFRFDLHKPQKVKKAQSNDHRPLPPLFSPSSPLPTPMNLATQIFLDNLWSETIQNMHYLSLIHFPYFTADYGTLLAIFLTFAFLLAQFFWQQNAIGLTLSLPIMWPFSLYTFFAFFFSFLYF